MAAAHTHSEAHHLERATTVRSVQMTLSRRLAAAFRLRDLHYAAAS